MSDESARPSPSAKKRDDKRRGGVRAIGALAPALTKQAIGKRGFTSATIITDWTKIVGAELARQSQPDGLRFPRGRRDGGVLSVRVDGPLATELMHLEPLVVERINTHFGYKAVERLKLIQAPIRRAGADAPRKAAPKPLRALSEAEEQALEARVAHIEDPELRAHLKRLGRSVMRRTLAAKPDQG
ncbi:MAG: DciA family protein [Marivibrio sp.]|uniref:DUF721 domain-containing protein n=1 Tax=Marivibrio sp. TaxID=2039719 RepID=UPI0032EB58D3